jgi:hypothetical protein
MIAVPEARTVRVDIEDAASGFRCGDAALDEFFARYACSNDERRIGRTYVLRRSDGAARELPRVLGYYTLSMTAISAPLIAKATLEKLPKYPIPGALIGRLAADERTRGSGLRVGETLLMDAFVRVLAAAENVGCFGVVVDAKHETAEGFYRRYDFATVDESRWPRKMFVAMGTVREMFAGTS